MKPKPRAVRKVGLAMIDKAEKAQAGNLTKQDLQLNPDDGFEADIFELLIGP